MDYEQYANEASNLASRVAPDSQLQLDDIVNYHKEFVKNTLQTLGTGAIGTKLLTGYKALKTKLKGTNLEKYGLKDEDLDDIEESLKSGDVEGAISKVTSRMTNKLTDAGRNALKDVRSKLQNVKKQILERKKGLNQNKPDEDEDEDEDEPDEPDEPSTEPTQPTQPPDEDEDEDPPPEDEPDEPDEPPEPTQPPEPEAPEPEAPEPQAPEPEAPDPPPTTEPSASSAEDQLASQADKEATIEATTESEIASTAEAGESVSALSSAATALDFDPVTFGVGLILGIAGLVEGRHLQAHTQKFEHPPEVLQNYSSQADV